MWNKCLAKKQLDPKNKSKVTRQFYKHSNLEPIRVTNTLNKDPILLVGGKLIRMIPMMEFFDRLITGATVGTRSCNNEIEDERY